MKERVFTWLMFIFTAIAKLPLFVINYYTIVQLKQFPKPYELSPSLEINKAKDVLK